MVFLPRTDFAAQERGRTIVETEILRAGLILFGWRQVPIDPVLPGREGRRHPPGHRTDPVRRPAGPQSRSLERTLYLVRRRIEQARAKTRCRAFTSARCRRAT
jgi:glutamate synthase (NADPH/NADH) large chain